MTGLLLDQKNLIKYNMKLQTKCDNHLDNESALIVLIQKDIYDKVIRYNKLERKKYIDSTDFINSIYFYCCIVYNRISMICELRNTIENPKYLKEVVHTIQQYLPNNFSIWTIPKSTQYEHYIKLGFNSPYIADKSPLKYNFKKTGIAFIKSNNSTIVDITSVENNLKHIFVDQPWMAGTPDRRFRPGSPLNCKIYAKFTKQAVKYLKELTTNKKEQAGSLVVSKVTEKNNKVVFELSEDTGSLKMGIEDQVDAVWSRYNFHTHPKTCYITDGVKRGWPSAQDYVGFVELNNHTIFHSVVTLEGIYCISYRPEWINKSDFKIDKKYMLSHYDISHKKQISFEEYITLINAKLYKGLTPLFIVKYIKWNQATKPFSIFFAKTDGACLVNDNQFNLLTRTGS